MVQLTLELRTLVAVGDQVCQSWPVVKAAAILFIQEIHVIF